MGHRRRASGPRPSERVQHHIAEVRAGQHDALDHGLRERARMIGALLGRAMNLRERPDVSGVGARRVVALVSRLAGDAHILQIEDRIDVLGTAANTLEGAGFHQIEPAFRAGREAPGRALMSATIPDNLLNESQASARDQRKEVVGQRNAAVRPRLMHADVDPHRAAGLKDAGCGRDPLARELDVVLKGGEGVAVGHADVQVGRRRHDQIDRRSSHPLHGGHAFALQEASRGRSGRRRERGEIVIGSGGESRFHVLFRAGGQVGQSVAPAVFGSLRDTRQPAFHLIDMHGRETFYISVTSDIEDVRSQLFADEFIGIYWTLPAHGRGQLPPHIDDATRLSFTVESQRRLVSAIACELRLGPSAEVALQFSRDLEWTEGLDVALASALAVADRHTVLITVDFQATGWRTHHALRHRIRRTGLTDIRVSAAFDLGVADHFALNRHWDQRHTALRKERRLREKSRRFQPDRQRLAQFHDYMRRRISHIDEWE